MDKEKQTRLEMEKEEDNYTTEVTTLENQCEELSHEKQLFIRQMEETADRLRYVLTGTNEQERLLEDTLDETKKHYSKKILDYEEILYALQTERDKLSD